MIVSASAPYYVVVGLLVFGVDKTILQLCILRQKAVLVVLSSKRVPLCIFLYILYISSDSAVLRYFDDVSRSISMFK